MTEEKILLPVEVKPEVEAIVNTVEKMTVEKQKNFLMFLWMWLHFNDKPDRPAGAA